MSYSSSTLLLGLLLNVGLQHFGDCLPTSLNLGLELAQPQMMLQQQTSNTPALERILADNFEGEFLLTEQVLGSLNKLMETFLLGQGLNQADMMGGHEISRWLASHETAAGQNSLLANQANELDFVFSTFWTPVMHLIQRIISERPNGTQNMAFRCEQREQEIRSLNELAQRSSIYRILLDVFNTELYTHCLRRKLATLRLNHVEPPTVVRQLVDVYLELPLDVAGVGSANFKLTDRARANYVNEFYANYGQNFNLKRAMDRYGPVERAVRLVLLTSDMSLGAPDESHAQMMANQFKEQCARYTGELVQYWGNFDQVAVALSSETNNLADLNNRLKYAQPNLIYASVCNQLTGRLT